MEEFKRLKVGDKVTVYKVMELQGPGRRRLEIESETVEVVGDAAGEPLCLAFCVSSPGRVFYEYRDGTFQVHEVDFSEEDAVRRYRGELLAEVRRHEIAAGEAREKLDRSIRLLEGRRAIPEKAPNGEPSVKTRVEGPGGTDGSWG